MDTVYHSFNMIVDNVHAVKAKRQDNGVITVTIHHKVHNCTENTYNVAELELVLFPAEGGILYDTL